MGQQIIQCCRCGEEILVELPGHKVGAVYVSVGYSNGGAVLKLERATEIVQTAAQDLPFREDLGRAALLLRQVACELVTVLDE